MFKRLRAWWRSRNAEVIALPKDARYVIESAIGHVLVTPPKTNVKIMPVVFSASPIESRQDYLARNPQKSAKQNGREWWIAQLPDECLFR